MADVYGRLTGKAGVCLGTLGPGATNLVTGVADANMDRAPLVCLIGQAGTQRLHKESHQNMDSVSMFRPITKWAQTVHQPDNIPEIVRKAFKVAEAEKPGAVLIELPEDIAEHEATGAPITPIKTRRPGADYKAVARSVDAIMGAKNPLILAGNGAIRKRASTQLRRLADLTGIGVVNTFMGKGAVPRSDEHCLYTVGAPGQGPHHRGAARGRRDRLRRLRPGGVFACLLEPGRREDHRPHRLLAGRGGRRLPGWRWMSRATSPMRSGRSTRRSSGAAPTAAPACRSSISARGRLSARQSTTISRRNGAAATSPCARRRCSMTCGTSWGRRTCCSRTWAPTRCGSPATTSVKRRTPA